MDRDTRQHQLTDTPEKHTNTRMSPLWVSDEPLEAGTIIDYVRDHSDRPQTLLIQVQTAQAVEMAIHYCSRQTVRQIIERQVRSPLYDTLSHIGPIMTLAVEQPLLGWEDGDLPPPSPLLHPGLTIADAYRQYISTHCGYQAIEQHATLIKRLANTSVDAENLRQRLEYLDKFTPHPSVVALMAREFRFRFDCLPENPESADEDGQN